MKNKRIFAVILCFIWVICIVRMIYSQDLLAQSKGRVECWTYPSVIQAPLSEGLAEWHQQQLPDKLERWTFLVKSQTSVKSFRSTMSGINLFSVGLNYRDIQFIEMEYGKFLWNEDVIREKPYIVLDSRLAFELFGSDECLGADVEIGEKLYKVVGICRPDRSSGRDSNYCAYIPLQREMTGNGAVGVIGTFQNTQGQAAEEQIKAYMKRLFPRNDVYVFNMDKMARLLGQKINLGFWGVGLGVIILFSMLLIKKGKTLLKELQEERKQLYFWQMMFKYKGTILCMFFSIACLLVLGILLLRSISTSLYIPQEWIPKDLMNINEYRRMISDNLINVNKNHTFRPASVISLDHLSDQVSFYVVVFWILTAFIIRFLYKRIDLCADYDRSGGLQTFRGHSL